MQTIEHLTNKAVFFSPPLNLRNALYLRGVLRPNHPVPAIPMKVVRLPLHNVAPDLIPYLYIASLGTLWTFYKDKGMYIERWE